MKLIPEQEIALNMALEFYIRMGLGQIVEIGHRLNILHGERLGEEKMKQIYDLCKEMEDIIEPLSVKDDTVSVYTLYALLLEAQVEESNLGTGTKKKDIDWTKKRIKALTKRNKEKI